MVARVGNNQLTREVMFNIQQQLSTQERLFEQISSNKKLLRPSDDPVGVTKSMQLNNQLRRNQEYENVVDNGDLWTNMTTTTMDNAIETWKRVNEIAISAADGTKTAEDRITMAEELEQLLQHMVQLSNTASGGRYIFGGSVTNNPPFRSESDPNTGRITGVFYEGDDFVRRITTKDGGLSPVNIVGSNAGNPQESGSFVDSNSGVDVFKVAVDLRDKLLVNDTIGLSGDGGILDKIDQGARNMLTAQISVGGTQERLDLDRNRIIQQNSEVEDFLSKVEDADLAQLILELNNVQNVYEAALASGGRILQVGLLNFI